jgi:hypothetical protein
MPLWGCAGVCGAVEGVLFCASGFGALQYGHIFWSSKLVLSQNLHFHMISPPDRIYTGRRSEMRRTETRKRMILMVSEMNETDVLVYTDHM